MIDRDLLLIMAGGIIGALSSMATIVTMYVIEGMRLRRQWQREDMQMLREKRLELGDILAAAQQKTAAQAEMQQEAVEQNDISESQS
jgi:hypothetical protein